PRRGKDADRSRTCPRPSWRRRPRRAPASGRGIPAARASGHRGKLRHAYGLLCGYPITNSGSQTDRGGAAMQTIKLGEVTISRVIEIDRSSFPTASMLPGSSPEVIAGHHRWLKPHFFDERTGDLASRIQTYGVKPPRHRILIDTGVGNDKARTLAPAWNMRTGGSYLDDLAAVGVTPEQVDFVVCTHLHVDHVGWNTRWEDGRWGPTFPNAKDVVAGAGWGVLEVRERLGQGRIGLHRRQRGAGGRRRPGAARRERLQDRRAPALRAVGRPHAGPRVRPPDDVGGHRGLLRRSHAPHGAGRRAAVVEPLLLRPGPGARHAARVRRAPRGFRHPGAGRTLPAPRLHRHGGGRLPVPPAGLSVARRPALEHQEASAGLFSNHGRAASSCAARRNNVASSPNRPTICTATGSPPAERPSGSIIAGWPLRLNH